MNPSKPAIAPDENPYRRAALESAARVVGEIMTERHGKPWVGIVKGDQ